MLLLWETGGFELIVTLCPMFNARSFPFASTKCPWIVTRGTVVGVGFKQVPVPPLHISPAQHPVEQDCPYVLHAGGTVGGTVGTRHIPPIHEPEVQHPLTAQEVPKEPQDGGPVGVGPEPTQV